MVLERDDFDGSNELKDVSYFINFSSEKKECKMDVSVRLGFDDNMNDKEPARYLLLASLITLFDLLVILMTITRFEGHDHVCKSQSVIFWTGVGMLNCLLCFNNIYLATNQLNRLNIFFLIALLNFINFSLIVLRILHKIGRVQINVLLGTGVS